MSVPYSTRALEEIHRESQSGLAISAAGDRRSGVWGIPCGNHVYGSAHVLRASTVPRTLICRDIRNRARSPYRVPWYCTTHRLPRIIRTDYHVHIRYSTVQYRYRMFFPALPGLVPRPGPLAAEFAELRVETAMVESVQRLISCFNPCLGHQCSIEEGDALIALHCMRKMAYWLADPG